MAHGRRPTVPPTVDGAFSLSSLKTLPQMPADGGWTALTEEQKERLAEDAKLESVRYLWQVASGQPDAVEQWNERLGQYLRELGETQRLTESMYLPSCVPRSGPQGLPAIKLRCAVYGRQKERKRGPMVDTEVKRASAAIMRAHLRDKNMDMVFKCDMKEATLREKFFRRGKEPGWVGEFFDFPDGGCKVGHPCRQGDWMVFEMKPSAQGSLHTPGYTAPAQEGLPPSSAGAVSASVVAVEDMVGSATAMAVAVAMAETEEPQLKRQKSDTLERTRSSQRIVGTPLHRLLNSPELSERSLQIVASAYPENWRVVHSQAGQTPLHVLCRNGGLNAGLLNVAIATMKQASASNIVAEAWTAQAQGHKNTPLHALCRNAALTMETLKVAISSAPARTWLVQNNQGATPLSALCSANPSLSPAMLNALAEAYGGRGVDRNKGVAATASIWAQMWRVRAQNGATAMTKLCRPKCNGGIARRAHSHEELLHAAAQIVPKDAWQGGHAALPPYTFNN